MMLLMWKGMQNPESASCWRVVRVSSPCADFPMPDGLGSETASTSASASDVDGNPQLHCPRLGKPPAVPTLVDARTGKSTNVGTSEQGPANGFAGPPTSQGRALSQTRVHAAHA